ncbi:MAG: hypothetical protein KAH96_04460 [Alphaproteobacteria bacterium]|nr:hypothetical protein [Alphaproteobacteria bacterium]
MFRCIDSRLNIVFDHSGSRSDHVELLIHLKRKEGYRIKVVALLIDKALAAKRAAGRDRYLPPEYIPERKKILDGLRPLYQAIADEYTMYKATSSGTVLLNQPMEHKKKYPDKKM